MKLWLYFAERNGKIKIGTTKHDPNKRMKAFTQGRNGKASVLLAKEIELPIITEQAIQDDLVQYRAYGEWFYDVPAVRNAMKLFT